MALARIAVVHGITWIAMLLAVTTLMLSAAILRWVAGPLTVLTVIVVPWSAFNHVRICRRGGFEFATHYREGAAVAGAPMLLMFMIERLLGIDLGLLPNLGMPWLLALLVTGLIGAVSSAVAWQLVIRRLRTS
jgi:hypothetical protein